MKTACEKLGFYFCSPSLGLFSRIIGLEERLHGRVELSFFHFLFAEGSACRWDSQKFLDVYISLLLDAILSLSLREFGIHDGRITSHYSWQNVKIFIILEIVILKKQFLNSILRKPVKELPEAGDRRHPWEEGMMRRVTLHGMIR